MKLLELRQSLRQLQQTAKKLLNRSLIIKNRNNDDWDGTHWVQYCKYRSQKKDDIDGSYIEVEFDKRLCPHLLQLSNKFLKANLNQLVSFSHIYSTRFYMIFRNLVNNLPKCTKKYTFKEIINLLELPKSYEKTVDLKNKVIKVSVNEINAKSDIEVEYEYYRGGGRAHIGVIFTFWLKEKTKKKEIPPATETEVGDDIFDALPKVAPDDFFVIPDDVMEKYEPESEPEEPVAVKITMPKPTDKTKWSEEQQADYDALIRQDVWVERAEMIVMTYDHARIKRNLEGVLRDKTKGTIANPPAVIVSAIKEDSYKGIAEEKAKVQARAEEKKREEWEKIKNAEDNRKKQIAEGEELRNIRLKYPRENINEVLEEVLQTFNENNHILTDEMVAKLRSYGLTDRHFMIFRSKTAMPHLFKSVDLYS